MQKVVGQIPFLVNPVSLLNFRAVTRSSNLYEAHKQQICEPRGETSDILKIEVKHSFIHFLNKNNLLTPKQSGFRPGDSTINQLLSITNEIHKAFDKYPSRESRAIFLDISKAFHKVWHEGIIFKLKSNGVSGKLFDLINI